MTDGRLGLKRWEPVFDWFGNDGFCFLYPPFLVSLDDILGPLIARQEDSFTL